VDGAAEKAADVLSEVGCGDAGGLVGIDGTGDGGELVGDGRMAADEVEDLLLVGVVAEGVDGSEGLSAEFLSEEVAGDDDCEDDEDECDGGTGVGVTDFGGEPVIGALSDDCQGDSSDDGGEEWLEGKGAEDQSGEGEEEEGGVLP
jgi:hypothetical protein